LLGNDRMHGAEQAAQNRENPYTSHGKTSTRKIDTQRERVWRHDSRERSFMRAEGEDRG
jgi:hypothetical protein